MNNYRSPRSGDDSSNQNELPDPQQEASAEGRSNCVPPPHPIEQTVFDRLNATIEATPDEAMDRLQNQALDVLGKLLQQWRLEQGMLLLKHNTTYDMKVAQLFCIENGIGKIDDISVRQLITLKMLLV